MNYIKLIIGKDIGSIIGKYLLPNIESNRKLNLISIRYNTYLIQYYLDKSKKLNKIKNLEYSRSDCVYGYGNKIFWTMR